MRQICKYIYVITLILFYLYGMVFTFVPLTSRNLVDIIGLISFGKDFINRRVENVFYAKRFVLISLFSLLWGFFSLVINGGGQPNHIGFIVIFLSFFGVYYIGKVVCATIHTLRDFYWLVAIAISVECLIAILIGFVPAVKSFFASIQEFQYGSVSIGDSPEDIFRFIGLGTAAFFGAYKHGALGLLLVTYLLFVTKELKKILLLLIMYLVIFVASFLTARISVIFLLISLLWIICKMFKNNHKSIITSAIFFFLIVWMSSRFLIQLLPDRMYIWAFEDFNSEGLQSATSHQVLQWWTNFDVSFKTFIIGDAIYTQPSGAYYGNVDVGFFRRILYTGIIGLLVSILITIKGLRWIYKFDKSLKWFLICFFVAFMGALAKGDDSIDYIVIMFLAVLEMYSRKLLRKKILQK